MIFRLNKNGYNITRIKRNNLSEIGWKEADFQKLLFDNLEKVMQDEDLMLIAQSRKWQEEPDLMAIDSKGDLYIFELKAWESKDYNLLQALRYGQIYGQYSYESLNELFLKFPEQDKKSLLDALNSKFEVNLTSDKINKKQHFIIITNGMDFKTRQAALYWADKGIDIKNWIYRIYKINEDILIEFDTFSIVENPFEDIEEGFWILNTNYRNNISDDKDMLDNQKASAFFDPWKRNIEKLQKGDRVFLYRSGEGIVANGIVSGKLEKKSHDGEENEEYFMKLDKFNKLENPIPASDVKKITGINYRFMSTMFAIDKESGNKLLENINKA
ncbi:MAG: hypothetical protein WA139_00815 [Candidatus Aenigmatarchaeota archaeon]